MAQQPNRKAVILSAFLTAFLLTLSVGSYALWQGWDTTSASAGADTIAPMVLPAQQALAAGDDPGVDVYQAQIEEAYSALNEAYAQIETLQAAQAQPQGQGGEYDDDDRDEHDDDEEHEHEGRGESEHEHDDD